MQLETVKSHTENLIIFLNHNLDSIDNLVHPHILLNVILLFVK